MKIGAMAPNKSKNKTIPGARPDWRAMWLSEYAKWPPARSLDDLSIMAWQFLRRNPEYQADWNRVWQRAQDASSWEEGFIINPRNRERWRRFVDAGGAPPDQDKETIYDPAGRERWALTCGYHDPNSLSPKHLRFMRPFGVLTMRSALLAENRDDLAPEIDDSQLLASFDISRDLRVQLAGRQGEAQGFARSSPCAKTSVASFASSEDHAHTSVTAR